MKEGRRRRRKWRSGSTQLLLGFASCVPILFFVFNCFANFISVSSFRLWISVPGSFLKIVCVLQFRRSVSGCGFSDSVNFKQFGSWVFQFCAIWGFNSIFVQFQVVSFSFCSVSGSFLPWFGLGA